MLCKEVDNGDTKNGLKVEEVEGYTGKVCKLLRMSCL